MQGFINGRGFTLVELLVGLTLTGIVSASLFGMLNSTRRFHRAQAEAMELNQSLRAAIAVIPAELRELDTGGSIGSDIVQMSPTGLRYRAMRTIGFLCLDPDTVSFTVAVGGPTFGVRAFDPAEDNLLIFSETDDRWLDADVVGPASGPPCPAGTGGQSVAVQGITRTALAGVLAGAPVRGYVLAELALYLDANGERWLGTKARDKATGLWSSMQPLAGPLSTPGLQLTYIDALGGPAAGPAQVVALQIAVTGLTPGRIRLPNGSIEPDSATLATRVAVRNNPRP